MLSEAEKAKPDTVTKIGAIILVRCIINAGCEKSCLRSAPCADSGVASDAIGWQERPLVTESAVDAAATWRSAEERSLRIEDSQARLSLGRHVAVRAARVGARRQDRDLDSPSVSYII